MREVRRGGGRKRPRRGFVFPIGCIASDLSVLTIEFEPDCISRIDYAEGIFGLCEAWTFVAIATIVVTHFSST